MTHSVPHPWEKVYPVNWAANWEPTPITTQLRQQIAARPEAVCFDFLGATMTYGALGEAIHRVRAGLQGLGLAPGERVVLLLPNTPFYPIGYFATLEAGAVVVNASPLASLDTLTHTLRDSEAKILITVDLAPILEKAQALQAQGCVETLIVCPFLTALPPIKAWAFRLFKNRTLARWQPSATCVDWRELPAPPISDSQAVPADPDAPAVLQYTGGTTGLPKGATLSHRNLTANVEQIKLWAPEVFTDDAVCVAVLPFFHIFAMTVCLNVPLLTGARIIALPRFEVKSLLKAIQRTRATAMAAVPTLLHAINTAPSKADLRSLKLVVTGGAALPSEVGTAFMARTGAVVIEGYGLTETAPVLACTPTSGSDKRNSIGLPFPRTELCLRALDDPIQLAPPDSPGEICARGPQVMAGYWRNEEATAQAFVEGWFRTGDVGRMDEDGYFYVVDRIKDIIISHGTNIYPRHIEDALLSFEAVAEACVIGVSSPSRGEVPKAFVVFKDAETDRMAALRGFLKDKLSPLERPVEIIVLDSIPKTLIGKPSRQALREL